MNAKTRLQAAAAAGGLAPARRDVFPKLLAGAESFAKNSHSRRRGSTRRRPTFHLGAGRCGGVRGDSRPPRRQRAASLGRVATFFRKLFARGGKTILVKFFFESSLHVHSATHAHAHRARSVLLVHVHVHGEKLVICNF